MRAFSASAGIALDAASDGDEFDPYTDGTGVTDCNVSAMLLSAIAAPSEPSVTSLVPSMIGSTTALSDAGLTAAPTLASSSIARGRGNPP